MVRIGGLASGMDIDSLVSNLMKAERMPLDKLMQKKQVLEWQRDDFRSMNTLLLDFRTKELAEMKLTSKYRSRTTSSTDDTKVSVSASSGANKTSYTISNVSKLAKAETQINLSEVTLDSSSSLYKQTTSTGDWKTGAVLSKSLTVSENSATPDGANFKYDLGLTNLSSVDHRSDWSINVSGKSFKVVTDPTQLGDNTVLVDIDGKLTFKKKIDVNSVINVDYIAQNKTVTTSLDHNTTTWQLANGPINAVFGNPTDSTYPAGTQIKLTKNIKDGNVETKTDFFFNVEVDGSIKDTNGNIVGTLDKASGKISFTDGMKNNGYLPPETPEAGKSYNFKMELTYSHYYTNFQIDTHTSKGEMHGNFLISGNESLNNVISKVNSSNVGASLFYDQQTKRMSLSRTETGDFNTDPSDNYGYEMVASGKFLIDVLKFQDLSNGSIPTANITNAQNAVFTINGLETNRSSNTFEMNGVTFTLKKEFTVADGSVSVSINNDSSKFVENIMSFVKKYNEVIDTIQKKVGEEKYRSYTPLTDDQREKLSDKQQELWEEKAKSGLLRRDPLLSNLLSVMRTDLYNPVLNSQVSSEFRQLATIGITTSANYLAGGKLEINEEKLREAVEKDPESVENLFRGTGSINNEKGIIQRLYDTVSNAMDSLKKKAGNSFSTNQQFVIGKELDNLGDSIYRFEDRLKEVENRYWKQFSAMEKAIQKSNQQSGYLMQQFGGTN